MFLHCVGVMMFILSFYHVELYTYWLQPVRMYVRMYVCMYVL